MSKTIKLTNNIELGELDLVRVKRTYEEMEKREEFSSNLWEELSNGFIETPARDLTIGESIYDSKGNEIDYRVA